MSDNENVSVRVGECLCPDTPHADGDFVHLRPKLGLAQGIELQQLFRNLLRLEPRPSREEITGLLCEDYLLIGLVGWTLEDDMGAIPVTRDNIKQYLLSDFVRAKEAGDVADDMYYRPVLGPLVSDLVTSLLDTPKKKRISRTNGSSREPRKRQKRSSTSTSQTVGTATTTS